MKALGRLPIRVRLTLAYTVIVTLIVGVFAAGTFALVRSTLLGQMDRRLGRQLDLAARTYEEEPGELGELEDHGAVPLYSITRGTETEYATAAWDRAHLGGLVAARRPGGAAFVSGPLGEVYRVRAAVVRGRGGDATVTVATHASPTAAALNGLLAAFLVAIPGVLVLAVLAGLVLAGRALAPVGAMAAQARRITADHLSERLPVVNPRDELGRLAQVFNDLLGRLEASFLQLRRFTADAAHELRTPLTAIRSVGEVGLETASTLDECREVVGSLLEEADRLSRLVGSLLLLTRGDAGSARLEPEPTDLARLAAEVVELMRPLAEERTQGLELELGAHPRMTVDRATLRQAVIDILDNAISYTPEGGSIHVRVSTGEDGDARIAVQDTGPGIPEEAAERIFDRFFRVEPSRSRAHGGLGLGLAVARWAVEANGGRIEVDSEPGRGSTFTIVLSLEKHAGQGKNPGKGGSR